MEHPGEAQLQRYLDSELDEEDKGRLCSHLQVCAVCRAHHDLQVRLREMVRASLPDPGAFTPDGEFWVRLAARLTPRPTPRWPLLPLLPPFLLAGLGFALEAAFTLVVGASALIMLGLLPTPADLVTRELPELLDSPLLENTLYAWLGWSSEEVVRAFVGRWEAMGAAAQHGILLGAPLMALIAALSAVEVLYLAWAMCWPGAARLSRKEDIGHGLR